MDHCHVEAGLLAGAITFVFYIIKWIFGFSLPGAVFGFPLWIVIFLGLYVVLYIFFRVIWNR